jgi:hypothetical protein
MRSFYLIYSKGQTVPDEFNLSWSHYLKLMRIDDVQERRFYEIESYKSNWSLRELQRQYDSSALYAGLALSRDQQKVRELSEKGLILEKPKDAIKDPYVFSPYAHNPNQKGKVKRARLPTLFSSSMNLITLSQIFCQNKNLPLICGVNKIRML